MKYIFSSALIISIIGLFYFTNNSFLVKSENHQDRLYCLYNICFRNQLVISDSLLDQYDYQGVQIKVFDLNLGKDEITSLDSLLNQNFKKLPFERTDCNEIPLLLRKYIDKADKGLYFNQRKENFGNKFIIINISRSKLIIYDIGVLDDLRNEDIKNNVRRNL